MTIACDYANLFEHEIRPRRRATRLAALALWAGLFVVRPKLAISIWQERHSTNDRHGRACPGHP